MNSVETNVSIITEKTGKKMMYIDLFEAEYVRWNVTSGFLSTSNLLS